MREQAEDGEVGTQHLQWVQYVETGEPEVVQPDQLESQSHVDVNIVNMLDYS